MRRLSEFEGLAGLAVIRDGAFSATGKLSTDLPGLCVPLRSAKYADEVNGNANVAAVITKPDIAEMLDARLAVCVAPNPDEAHSEIHAILAKTHAAALQARANQIDSTARIDPSAHIADHGIVIGPRVWIGPHVTINPGVHIDADTVLHSGVSLGMPGFNTGIIGGRQRIIPQIGGVKLHSYVELLSNVCVARALFGGNTVLGEEVVADNLVYIAHDVQIARRVQICALANILGRAVLGENAYIGPSAVIKNGIHVGADAKVSIGAVVTQNVAAKETVSGNFAIEHGRFLDHIRSIR